MPTGSGFTFNIDSIRFDKAMAAFRSLGIESKVIVKDETRFLVKQVIKFTPPKTLAQGRKAVARDIKNAMEPLDDTKFTSKKISMLIRNKDVNSMREVVRRIPTMKASTVEEFDPVRLHERRRDSRGRVQRSKGVFVLDKKGWKKYVSKKQKNVGSAKAGWWPSLAAVGGSVPSWVSRHSNRFGSVDTSRLESNTSPRIRIQNFSTAANSQNQQNHQVESAVRMRARSMEGKARHMVEQAAKAGGLTVH